MKKKKNVILRCLEYRVLHIDDTPHKVALGVALGLFIGWTPLIGVHIFLAIFFSVLLRANKFAALVSIWVSNVFTYLVIFYPSYLFGRFLFNLFGSHNPLTHKQILDSLNRLFAPQNMISGFYTKEYWSHLWFLLKSVGPELWVGCVTVGGFVAIVSYFVCLRIIKAHRAKNPHRRYRKY